MIKGGWSNMRSGQVGIYHQAIGSPSTPIITAFYQGVSASTAPSISQMFIGTQNAQFYAGLVEEKTEGGNTHQVTCTSNISTSTLAVTSTCATAFSPLQTGGVITINGVNYGIASVQSATALTLQNSAGSQTNVTATWNYEIGIQCMGCVGGVFYERSASIAPMSLDFNSTANTIEANNAPATYPLLQASNGNLSHFNRIMFTGNTAANSFASFPGPVSSYNGYTTGGIGIVPIMSGAIHSTGLTGSVSTATLCAAGTGSVNSGCPIGNYEVHFNFIETGTACATPSTGGVTFLLTWTDTNGTAHSAVSLPMIDATSLTTLSQTFHFQTALASAYASGDFHISTNGAVIQYATGYTACGAGTGTYQLDVSTTRMQ